MLVLSRKMDQKIMIGDAIAITVVAISRDKVRLGIDAPKEIPVHRREVYDAIKKAEQAQAEEPEAENAKSLPEDQSQNSNLSAEV